PHDFLDFVEPGPANRARAQVFPDRSGRLFVRNPTRQVLFVEMVHDRLPIGASSRRSFWTARNTVCLTAFGPILRTSAIPSIDRPSRCRRTNAARSRS